MVKRIKDLATKEVLNTREAANLIKVTTQTIKNYIYSGKLKAIKTPADITGYAGLISRNSVSWWKKKRTRPSSPGMKYPMPMNA